jgi:hypothetical protein
VSNKTFAVLRYDPTIWQVLETFNDPDQPYHPAKLKAGSEDQPSVMLVDCEKVEDTTYGFLRLTPVSATGTPRMSVAIPAMLVAAILEMGKTLPPGFLDPMTRARGA